jgi:hypothetical protein
MVDNQMHRCTSCNGQGFAPCHTCDARGYVRCSACDGCGNVVYYNELKVTFTNHLDYEVISSSGIPDDVLRQAKGPILTQ